MLTIKAFKATNDESTSLKYAKGHEAVLKEYNVPKVTSSNTKWIHNPGVYGIIVEDDHENVVGGARIHVKSDLYELPIEMALRPIDQGFEDWMTQYRKLCIAEMCGLWNSKQIAGKGISNLLMQAALAKSGLAIANQLGINVLIGFCAPWTINAILDLGFEVAKNVGDQGTYNYPKPDLKATVAIVKDTENLTHAIESQRARIFDLRERPEQTSIEDCKGDELTIKYELTIPGLNPD